MDSIWENAIAEAYASAPQDTIVLHALEINHPSFTQPVRVVNYPVSSPEPEVFHCKLENDAPINAGEVVDFIGMPFELALPEKTTSSPGSFTVKVENVGDRLDDQLWEAALHGGAITAVYREFIKGAESEGPAAAWPHITIKNPSLHGQTLVFEGAVMTWMPKAFGGLYYPSDYPAIKTT